MKVRELFIKTENKKFKVTKWIAAIAVMLLTIVLCDFDSNASGLPMFDPIYYAQNNPDVVAALGNNPGRLFGHYKSSGIVENRIPYEGARPGMKVTYEDPKVLNMINNQNKIFDSVFYAQNNPDVVAVFGNDSQILYQHYISNGIAENRIPFYGAQPGSYAEFPMNLSMKSDVELADYIISKVIVSGMSPEEAVNAVNDYLCYHIEYDLNYYTVFDAIVNKVGRCQAYANTFKCVMERIGIPTEYCRGIGYTGGTYGSHAWNRSLINGTYYYTDVCWNDYGKFSDDEYLLLSYEEISKDHQEIQVLRGYAQ